MLTRHFWPTNLKMLNIISKSNIKTPQPPRLAVLKKKTYSDASKKVIFILTAHGAYGRPTPALKALPNFRNITTSAEGRKTPNLSVSAYKGIWARRSDPNFWILVLALSLIRPFLPR
jgi:hypothetical protein